MRSVGYTDIDGFRWQIWVPDMMKEDQYGMGIIIGPPSLKDLPLDLKQIKKLQRLLVDRGVLDAEDFMKKKAEIVELIRDNGWPKELVRHLASIYQRAYYPEQEE